MLKSRLVVDNENYHTIRAVDALGTVTWQFVNWRYIVISLIVARKGESPLPLQSVPVSIESMNRFVLAVAAFLVAVPLSAETLDRANLALEIQKATQTKFGYQVSVLVKNVSGADVVVGRTGAPPSKLQFLDIQQWDEKFGWKSVGPCRDVGRIGVLTIAPQSQLEDVVPIGDLGMVQLGLSKEDSGSSVAGFEPSSIACTSPRSNTNIVCDATIAAHRLRRQISICRHSRSEWLPYHSVKPEKAKEEP